MPICIAAHDKWGEAQEQRVLADLKSRAPHKSSRSSKGGLLCREFGLHTRSVHGAREGVVFQRPSTRR